jgi:hypothetical protein
MPWTNSHLEWLHKTSETIVIACGKAVPVFEFEYDVENEEVMSLWVKHFRNYYCLDNELPDLKSPNQSNLES